MHIYFSGIGGAGIGPLALIAHQAGFKVSGSDKQDSGYIAYLKEHGVTSITIGQNREAIEALHKATPIDWFVYSSALPKENPEHPELVFASESGIRHSKRDEFLNYLLESKKQKMIAIAGTHGKSTTTAMAVWVFKQLGVPISYSVGAKLSFGEMGEFKAESRYFVYECDEYDRNFLSFYPGLSLITGVAWDHNDIYPTPEIYDDAFRDFFKQSERLVMWRSDYDRLKLSDSEITIINDTDENISRLRLLGEVNRRNAWQVITAISELTGEPIEKLIKIVESFPGLSRRFEKLKDKLYTDYAHTAEKIAGAMQVALEADKNVVVVYEGLHNRRQHFMLERGQFEGLFHGARHVYWVPSYLAREDPHQKLLTPAELIELTKTPQATAMQLDDSLKNVIEKHLEEGDLVLCISAGGGGSLDEWLRRTF